MACELCTAEHKTSWLRDESFLWAAYCSTCNTPMVVLRKHGTVTPAEFEMTMTLAEDIGNELYGQHNYKIRMTQRQITDHFHVHVEQQTATPC